ncbi:hypothetical protein FKX85_19710 [Echinicola soli]|uniref:HTH luxR-type domain-containing protein n=1 Tax=Echinicola soli TaxID=2591634 RepID=A0A514CMU3_9BACT|nr:LuxR C-terminal-related transcriptional regulator [Echinicola soli]QDH81136.1 hypothetical protein FKX85_19710 [Echinicola soli]
MLALLRLKLVFGVCFGLFFEVSGVTKHDDYVKVRGDFKDLKKDGKYEEAINHLLNYIEEGDGTGNEIAARIDLGNVLWVIGKFEKSLEFLGSARTLLHNRDDFLLKGRLHQEFAQCFSQLGLHELALEHNKKAMDFLVLEGKGKVPQGRMQYLINTRARFYFQINEYERAMESLRKGLEYGQGPIGLSYMLNYFLNHRANQDSADHYFKKMMVHEHNQNNSKNEDFWINLHAGRYYLRKDEWNKANSYLGNAIQIAEEIQRLPCLISGYQAMIELYREEGNKAGELELLNKLVVAKDSMQTFKRDGLKLSVATVVRLNEEIKSNWENKFVLFITISGLALCGMLVFYLKKRKVNLVLTEKVIDLTDEKNNLLISGENGLEEVVQLAKNNEAGFLAKFEEVYPDWMNRIMGLHPDLTRKELELSAMLYLNFSTKEIASFTFVQHKTVQMRKYRLRKKLHLDSKSDLYLWAKTL